MGKKLLDYLFGSPNHEHLAEAMAAPLKTAMKKGRFGFCIDCGANLLGVLVHPEDECLVRSVLES